MTSTVRLAAALALTATALFWGWFSGGSGDSNNIAPSSRAWSQRTSVEAEDIDAYVTRVAEAGLFPSATLRAETTSGSTDSAEGLARALYTPNLSAFVRRDLKWRIYVYDDNRDTQIFEEGDQLSDGWLIASIAPSHIVLRRDAETRRLDAFRTGEVTDEN
jgi:hypothetical protein